MSSNRSRQRRVKQVVRRCCHALLVAIILLTALRNPIARLSAVKLGSHLLDMRVEIDAVWIGWSVIEVKGLRIHEPTSEVVPLAIAKVEVATSPWRGIRNGIWARRVIVHEPTLQLRFDRHGELLTPFPAVGESDQRSVVIPIFELLIREGAVAIHQTGRKTLTLDGAQLDAQFGSSIRLHGQLPSLFGGVVHLRSDVDAKSFAGRSTLSVDGIAVDTKQLSELPLMPIAMRAEPVTAIVSLSGVIEHPPNQLDPRRHDVKLLLHLRELQSQSAGRLANDFSLSVTSEAGALAARARGDLIDGVVNLEVAGDLLASPMTAELSATGDQVDLARIASRLLPAVELQAITNLQASASLTCDRESVSFAGSLRSVVTEVVLDRIHVSDVHSEVNVSGALPLNSGGSLTGRVDGILRTDGVAIKDLAERFNLPKSEGRVAATGELHASLSDLSSPEAYHVLGTLQTTNVSVGSLSLRDATGILELKDGFVSAAIKDAGIYGSQASRVAMCSAKAEASLVSDGLLTTSIEFSVSPTAELASLAGLTLTDCGGELFAEVSASCPLTNIAKSDAWAARGSVWSQRLVFAGEAIDDLEASFELASGRLVIPSFPLRWQQSGCQITATGSVGEQVELRGEFSASPIQLSNIAQLASRFSATPLPAAGLAELDGQFRVAAWPLDLEVSGTARLKQATYAGKVIGQADLTWEADLEGGVLRSASKEFLGGRYSLEATTRDLDWTKTVIEGHFDGIQASRLAALLDRQIPVSGAIDGGLRVTSIANLDSVVGHAWLTSRGLSIHRVQVEVTTANLTLSGNEITASCAGMFSDGHYQATAKSNLAKLITFLQATPRRIERVPIVAQARIEDLSIESLTRTFPLPNDLRTLAGRVSASCARDPEMLDGTLLCKATSSLSDLRLNQITLSDRITSNLSVTGDRVQIDQIDGRFADGRLSGNAKIQLAANPSGNFDFLASRVNLRRIAASASAAPISGSGTLRLQGRLGEVINGRALASVDHAVLAGVSVPNATFPIDWSFSPRAKLARWQCRNGVVSAGGGKVYVSSEGSFGTSLNMTTLARIERVDSSKLLRNRSIGAGVVNGNLSLRAKRARSPKQLVGDFDFVLSGTQSLEMPVLNQLPKLTSLSLSTPGRGKDGGTVQGRIADGRLHIDQLAISQSDVQVLMSGNATMEGRLDFDVTVSTQSSGLADQLLSLVDSPLMLAAPAPIGLVSRANELLKDRVVHAHVGGIASRPSLRLQPGKQLSQTRCDFFSGAALESAQPRLPRNLHDKVDNHLHEQVQGAAS